MDRVLVTGGAGFIGSNLVEKLLADGYGVVAYDNLLTGKKENLSEFEGNDNFRFVQGDILDLSVLGDTLDDIDYVLHQAALPSVSRSVEDPARTNDINIRGTLNVLNTSRDMGVKKVVLASSSSVYGDTPELPKREDMPYNPLSPYAVTKVTKELYSKVFTELYGLPAACLRYFNVYGAKQDPKSEYAAVIPKFVTSALKGEPLTINGDGLQTRDFTYIDDVVQANIKAMLSDATGNFNIAFGENISIKDLAEKIVSLTSSGSEIIHVDPRPGDVKDSLADITQAEEGMDYRPQYDLESGLPKTIEYFKSLD